MLDCLKAINWKKTGVFAAGVLFGTAGIKVLSSKDAKKVYTNCTAAVLRAKECVMNTVTTVQENAGDIYEEAKNINEERAAAAEAAAKAEEEKKAARLVKVKVKRRFRDMELNQIKDTGDVYTVSRERAAVLKEAGVAEVAE